MIFRDSKHRSSICHILLEMKGMERFWCNPEVGHGGPSPEAMKELTLLNEERSILSTGEQVLLRVVLDLWNGAGGASFHQITTKLDEGVALAIGELMVAGSQGPALIDEWEKQWKGYDPNEDFFAS